MSTRRRGANNITAASSGGSGKKRARSKLNINLSSHGGQYEDLDDDDNNTPTLHDEELDSDDNADDDLDNMNASDEEDSEEEEEETVDAKRLRLARNYLTKMKAQQSSSSSEEESDDDSNSDDNDTKEEDKLGKRIAKERLKKSGLLQLQIANTIQSSIQMLRSSIANDIGIDAASQAWLGSNSSTSTNNNTQQQQQDEIYSKSWLQSKYITYHRGHDLSPTSVALSSNGHVAYSGSKDGSLLMWNVVNGGKKLNTILPVVKGSGEGDRNTREILSIATSDDDRYLAVGGRDNCVRIFDIRTLGKNTTTNGASTPITTLSGHKKAVTSLSFRSRTLDLYSGSEDRCIRRYDLNALTYVETLYGHQSSIIDIDCATKNRPVSIAQDRTVRLWKVEEDSHLVYRPGGDVSSAECVCAIQDGWFITGHDDGRLALWKEEKKRPVGEVVVAAHGYANGNRGVSRSVMCCDGLKLSDVLATGSNDGYLRLWRVNTSGDKNEAGISPLESVPIHGHINSIAMGPEGKFCVAAVGQEPRLGRWDRVPRAKNRFAIIKLNADGEE